MCSDTAKRQLSHKASQRFPGPQDARRENLKVPLPACAACGKADPGVKLKKCGHCGKVSYCSVDCQRQHWKQGGHKQACSTA